MPSRSLPPITAEQTVTVVDGRGLDEATEADFGLVPATGTNLGRYVVLEKVGSGGMGVVLRAYDPKLQREVALKRLRSDALDQRAADRMVREAQVMAKLSHPNVVAVYDVEVIPPTVLLVMEFVQGQTLRTWLKERTRERAKIMDAFIQAGRGLAAAHAEGLVHRDFKPDNVLVGRDGRVRVTDFGLARAMEEPGPSMLPSEPVLSGHSEAPDSLASPMTEDGTVIGTPPYMAPEQHKRSATDARTDQYAFCLALWEALAGARPFVGDYRQLVRKKLEGPPPWPRDAAVPRAVQEALRRGLAVAPEDRWPSMESLLAVLDHDPSRKRLRWITAAAIGVATVATVGAVVGWQDRGPAPCTGAPGHLEGIWDDARRQQVTDAMRATEVEYADHTLSSVLSTVDRYTEEWVQVHTDACEATSVRREQSDEVLDLRMACLERRLYEVDALVEVLTEADEAVVERSVDLVVALAPLAPCSNVEFLRAAVPTPEDPALATTVQTARRDLARAEARADAGRYEQALSIIDALDPEATAYPHLQVDVVKLRALVLLEMGHYDEVETLVGEAYPVALSIDHQKTAAQLMSTQAFVVGARQMREAEARILSTIALSIADRLDNRYLRVVVLNDLAGILDAHAHYDEAVETFREVLAIQQREFGEQSPILSTTLNNLAVALRHRGEFDEAFAIRQRRLDIERATYGDDHPHIARSLNAMGNMLHVRGEYERAQEFYSEALAMNLRLHGSEHPNTAYTLSGLGMALTNLGQHATAEQKLRRAVEILEKEIGADHLETLDALTNLAIVVEEQGRYEEAYALHQRALQSTERVMGPGHPRTGFALNNVAGALLMLHREDEALPLLKRATTMLEKAMGREHPNYALVLINLADALRATGRLKDAAGHLRHALPLIEGAFGVDHIYCSYAVVTLGRVLHAMGDDRGDHRSEVLELLERGHRLRDSAPMPAAKKAEAALALALALGTDPEQRERARTLAQHAHDLYETAGPAHQRDRDEAHAWLEAHPGPTG